ncbi:hypothetical protein ACSVDA_11440 [Cytobacillus sp. Hm23]
MKTLTVFMVQFMIWSAYSIIEWLSRHDGRVSKSILLAILIYFAYIIAQKAMQSKKRGIIITIISLPLYFLCRELFWAFAAIY